MKNMNKSIKFITGTLLSLALTINASIVEAKRFGGGKNAGRQNTTAIQRANDPAQAPSMPSQQNAQRQNQNMPPPQAQPQRSRFGGMAGILGGIAAGIGLAWLASKLGLSAGFANILLIILIIFIGIMLFRIFKQKKLAAQNANNYSAHNINYPNNSDIDNKQSNHYQDANPNVNANYNAHPNTNVPAMENKLNNLYPQEASKFISYPVEISKLVEQANFWFNNIQQLSAEKNYSELQKLLTPELFNIIKQDLQNSPMLSHTIVQNLQSNLLDWRESNYEWLATIQYKADVSEDGAPSTPINEAWTFTKDKAVVNEWKIDGISQLNQ